MTNGRSSLGGSSRGRRIVFSLATVCIAIGALTWFLSDDAEPSAPVAQERVDAGSRGFNRDDNGVWLRRQWIHGGSELDVAQLGARLQALGITRVYPFLGPIDYDGNPGWRHEGAIQPYVPERAGAFFRALKAAAPGVRIVPWSGGHLEDDVRLLDLEQRTAYLGHIARIIELGADGIHINIEPMPSHTVGYLDLLRAIKARIGEDHVLSIAAYPPTTPLQPVAAVHWTLEFTREVCLVADELAVMAYDTGLTEPEAYEGLMADWTADLIATLPPPSAGGCELLIGVPAYEDDEDYHRPDVENLEHGIRGVLAGLLRRDEVPDHFRGIAIYASWTTDADEWALYDRLWRSREPTGGVLPDFEAPQP